MTAPKKPTVSKSNANDHLALQWTNHETANGTSQSIYETVEGSHECLIKGYSLAKGMGVGKSMTSSKFTVGGYDWILRFYPDGHDKANEEYICIDIKLVSPGEVRVLFEFKLLDQSGKGIHSRLLSSKTPVTIKSGRSWGFINNMKRSELETSGYLKDDCINIHCKLGVLQTRVEEGKRYVIHVPPSDMNQNLQSLLESEIGSDITIKVGNECFRVHKLFLAARSPYFMAQFFGSMGNPDMKTLVIEECDPFAFKAMLLFLYSDELPETHKLSQSDSLCTRITFMQHLLSAADRFGLARLKLMCEEKLSEEITANTVATTLVLAEQHQCQQLKTVCLDFTANPRNMGEVLKSDGYAYLEKTYPSILADLLKTKALVNKK